MATVPKGNPFGNDGTTKHLLGSVRVLASGFRAEQSPAPAGTVLNLAGQSASRNDRFLKAAK
jgi:hypothetical protein